MGTPGHMAHPFDVERVKTGQDLIDFINDAVDLISQILDPSLVLKHKILLS